MIDFSGTNAVVTGASSGIGRAIAIELARAGAARLVVHYRQNMQAAEQTVTAVRDLGCDASLMPADLSRSEELDRFVDFVFEQLGEVHTWVNNAGADVLTGDAANHSFDQKLRRLLDVDVVGTILLARRAADRMVAQSLARPSSMTFIGWDQAPQGMEGDAGQMFGPVKAAVMAFANALAQSAAPRLRVNVVAPGWIQTAWGASASEYWDTRAKSQSLMNRWGTTQDVARAVLCVADPKNEFLHGQTIDVNGGWNRRFDADGG